MQDFEFQCPTQVVFGKGMARKVADKVKSCGGSRVFIVYGGGSAVRSGLIAKVESLLTAAGVPFQTMGGVQPNPRVAFVRQAQGKAAAFGADFLLAVGGGSVIDTCKALAIALAQPGTDIWELWTTHKAEIKTALPVGVILTIPAAGSETSDSAVLSNPQTGEKRGVNTPLNRPRFAILDPQLALTLPPFQVACGVTDMLMHTLDRYFTVDGHNEVTDAIAEALMRVIISNGRIAMRTPGDYHSMSELMWAGSLSHNNLTGLGNPKDFSVHQLGHALSARFDVAHGASLSAVWGAWAGYVHRAAPERFAQYAQRVWRLQKDDTEEAALAGISMTVRFFRSIGMPTCLSELAGVGVQQDSVLHELAIACMYGGTRTVGTFCKLDIPDAYEIYRSANY